MKIYKQILYVNQQTLLYKFIHTLFVRRWRQTKKKELKENVSLIIYNAFLCPNVSSLRHVVNCYKVSYFFKEMTKFLLISCLVINFSQSIYRRILTEVRLCHSRGLRKSGTSQSHVISLTVNAKSIHFHRSSWCDIRL